MAVAVAVIGAVFGELVGSDAGLGHAIQVGTAQLLTARVFAAVLLLSVMAIALFALVSALERRAVPWAHSGADARHEARSRPRSRVALALRGARAPAARRPSTSAAACEVRGLDLALDWFPNPDHVAIYEAIEQGYFRDVGLDVQAARALRPGGADQAGRRRAASTSRSPTSPRCCSRASRDFRWSPSPRSCSAR